jgi:nucleotide-binding universal stress UspA family protein
MLPRAILSTVDFSDHSRHALRWAEAFAARLQSRLTVLSVVDPLLAEAARIRLGQDLARAETEPALREFVSAAWSDEASLPERPVVKTAVGEPAAAILDAAKADRADLIVMGTQGLGGFRKWLLGSTTERLLRRTDIPVLAVPPPSSAPDAEPGGRDFAISHLLAATDFSESSVAAAKAAVELSVRWSASLTLVHVLAPLKVPAQWQGLVQESEEARVASARAALKALAEKICGTCPCEDLVVLGHPAEMIGSIARERRVQLIVMGLSCERGVFATRPGSIAYRVLCSSTVPVLVVPAAEG